MIKTLVSKVFGSRQAREVKRLTPLVEAIHRQEELLRDLSEEELKGQTARFRVRIAEQTGSLKQELDAVRQAKHHCEDPAERVKLEEKAHLLEREYKKALKAVLDDLLPEAFATVREACRRLMGTPVMVTGHELTWDMVPYDVQLIGGIELHRGRIAEMATGEGKTLVATLPLYLNALAGRGAHLVTVNNYLARRDSQWMGHVYKYLGLTVGCIDDTEPSTPARRDAYNADITYGTNNEFGFDYLRDNMVFSLDQRVQRERAYAIVDEVLHPHRRGPDSADHQRPGRERRRREVHPVRPPGLRPGPAADRRGEPADRRGRAAPGRRQVQGRRRGQTVPGPPGHAQEQEAAQAAQRDWSEAAGAAGRAGLHRRPHAALPAAEDAGPRGGAVLRAGREGALGPPDRSGLGGAVPRRSHAVPRAGHLGGGARHRARREPGSAGEARRTAAGRGGVRRQEREAAHHPQAAAGPLAL